MRGILEPTEQMANLVDSTLADLKLTKQRYTVIHVRSGDKYLKGGAGATDTFNAQYIQHLTKEIFILIKNNLGSTPISNYLVLSDNPEIKRIIGQAFPSIKMLFNKITHFGSGVIQEDLQVRNTMVEFNLMSFSSAIFSFSCYEHGSGFSQWCAKTYDVPYVCKLIT